MGFFEWLFGQSPDRVQRQSGVDGMPPALGEVVPEGETRRDLGSIETGVTVNGVPLVFSATMTTYDEVPDWMRESEGDGRAPRVM